MTNKFERQVKGLLGTKLGMTQVWTRWSLCPPSHADSNVVTRSVTRRLMATKLFRLVSVQRLAKVTASPLVT